MFMGEMQKHYFLCYKIFLCTESRKNIYRLGKMKGIPPKNLNVYGISL